MIITMFVYPKMVNLSLSLHQLMYTKSIYSHQILRIRAFCGSKNTNIPIYNLQCYQTVWNCSAQ